MKKSTLAAAAAIVATAGTALYTAVPALAQMQADAPTRGPGAMMTTTMTWADAKAKADAAWTRLDVNGDGKLDSADRDAKMGKMFDNIDTNHDGSISRDEFMAHHRGMMDHDDKPGGPPPPPMADGKADGAGKGWHKRGMGGGMGGAMGMLRMADTNNDGVVTRAEYDASVKAMFDKADTNHDGKVTPEERRAAFMSMHGRRGGMGGQPAGQMPPPPAGDDDQ